ncbi:MAG: 4Fe-4S dicluster domain-containing protein [Gammaproteobacteria bacterium]|nr:4Fe-4S dicluster domain-containing protein [Gammaproteobacteria bacterium]
MSSYVIAPVNYVLLAVLLPAALASLVVGLRRQWARVTEGGQGDAAFWLPRLLSGMNWRTFGLRGLLTSRLFKRPLAGLAHGLLFFGALVEIAGHTVVGLAIFGIDTYQGRFGFFFMELGRELAGLMMLAGIAILLVRRLIPPERITAGGSRRAFLPMEVLLLAVVLLGFVAEAFRLTDPGAGSTGEFLGRTVAAALAGWPPRLLTGGNLFFWWVHGLAGLSFIALIAWTPMSHMLLGPANAALANRRSGINLRPIDFDAPEDEGRELVLGAAKLADLLPGLRLDFSACTWCGRCSEVCPATQTGKALSPKKVMVTCAGYQAERRFEDASLIDAITKEAVFDCTTCGACIEQCPVSNKPAEAILEFRRHFVMDRSDMPEMLAAANRNLESRGHPFVGTAANPDDWRKGLEVPVFEPGRTEYLLWLGCAVTFEERAQSVARAMVTLLNAAGVSWGILGEHRCTGDPAKTMGNELLFVETATDNIAALQERQVHRVITMCAHCFNSFDRYYPQFGGTWETIPHSVLIDRLIKEGRLQPERRAMQKITFHDPCYHARHNDLVDESRSVVSAVGELLEMPRNRKDSFCCGSGGARYWDKEGGKARIGDVRAEEALATGADRVATACPFCLLMLTSSAARQTEQRKVFDIAELVVEALPGAPRAF